MTDQVKTRAAGSTVGARETAQLSFAILLGVFILFGTAFAQIGAAHDAAHDSRHSFAFPCH